MPNNKRELTEYRKSLRRNMTKAEAFLWQALKGKALHGGRFRRQFSIDDCIVDFYCPACKLAIEVDGAAHLHRGVKDAQRDEKLSTLGITVLRFTNTQVLQQRDKVLEEISKQLTIPEA